MKFLIVDDHEWARDALGKVLCEFYPEVTILEAKSVIETLDALTAHPDIQLVLLDLKVDDCDGIDTLTRIKNWVDDAENPPRIVIVSAAADYDQTILIKSIEECATGFISKGTPNNILKAAIALTLAGDVYITPRLLKARSGIQASPAYDAIRLTPRERNVVNLIKLGTGYKEIARKLNKGAIKITHDTVRVHVKNVAWKIKAADPKLGDLPAKATILAALADERWRQSLLEQDPTSDGD